MVGVERPKTPQALFTRVARSYDLVNSLFSLGFDRRWRRQAAMRLRRTSNPSLEVLDLCCGTGAMGVALRQALPRSRVVGVDLNEQMLATLRDRRAQFYAQVERSAAETLPFEERSFDAAAVSMAFHDLDDPTTVVHELRRVLRPGGDLLLLELTLPDDLRVRLLYRGFLRSLRAIRDLLRLGAFGQVVDEILNDPGHSVVIDCLVSNGFAFDGYVQHGAGLTTSYLFRFVER